MADVIDNQAKQPSSGTGFTNLSRVLNANQNNRLGNTINTGVSNVVGQANQGLNQAQQDFSQQSQKGTIGTAQDKQYVQNTLQDPTKAQQSDYDKFAQYRQGYTGPQGLQSDKLQAQQQDINSLGGLTNSSGGRQALLQRFVGSPQYNQGQQQLDTLLLGQGGNLNQLRRQTQQANQNINQAYGTAANQANLLKAQSAGFGQDVANQLSGAQTAQDTELGNRAQQYTQEEQALHDTLANLFTPVKDQATPTGGNVGIGLANQQTGPNGITQDQYDKALAAIGRSGQGGQDLLNQAFYGANAVQGFDPNAVLSDISAYTNSQAATDQDIAKAQALQKLQGQQDFSGLAAQKAGGYDPLSFINNQNLQKYEGQGKGLYDTAGQNIKSAQDYMTDLNRVKDIQQQQGQLALQGKQALQNNQNLLATPGGQPIGGLSQQGFTPEQQAQFDALQSERGGLAQKDSLGSANNVLANYAPATGYADPYLQSIFDQGIAGRMGNATQDVTAGQAQQNKYNNSTISDRLKKLIQQPVQG